MEKPDGRRKKVSDSVLTKVLASSARRCALCFFLDGDVKEKLGQIAHLDQDPGNSDEDNLAFMCLKHHSLYDSRTSQHKNYTLGEVKSARENLYKLVSENRHLTPETSLPFAQIEADKRILRDFLECVPSSGSISYLDSYDFGAVIDSNNYQDLDRFYFSRKGPEFEFLDPELEVKRQMFRTACKEFQLAVASNTEPMQRAGWHRIFPDWQHEKPERYREAVDTIHNAADRVVECYNELVRLARRKLAY